MKVHGFVGHNAQLIEDSDPAVGWILMQYERPTMAHIAQADGSWALPANKHLYSVELAELNSQYEGDIAALRDAYTGAALAGGVNQATKQAAITARFDARKAKYIADSSALLAKHGV